MSDHPAEPHSRRPAECRICRRPIVTTYVEGRAVSTEHAPGGWAPGDVLVAKTQWRRESEADLRFAVVEVLSPTAVRVKIVGSGKVLDLASTMFEEQPVTF